MHVTHSTFIPDGSCQDRSTSPLKSYSAPKAYLGSLSEISRKLRIYKTTKKKQLSLTEFI